MPADITITKNAADKSGLTFAELREFVQAAMRNDMPDDAVLTARISMGGKLRQITAAAPQRTATQASEEPS